MKTGWKQKMERKTKGIAAAMITAIAACGHYAQPTTTEVGTVAGQIKGVFEEDNRR